MLGNKISCWSRTAIDRPTTEDITNATESWELFVH